MFVLKNHEPVARLRILLTVVLGVFLTAGVIGCAGTEQSKEAVPVSEPKSTEQPGATGEDTAETGAGDGSGDSTTASENTTTTIVRSATSMGPGGSSVSSTTSPEQTLPTLPLRYADETRLLKEIAPAYYAAIADFKASSIALTPDAPELANHIGGPQLEVLRKFIRGDLFDGYVMRERTDIHSWIRVENLTQLPSGDIELEVCLIGNSEALFGDTRLPVDPGPFRPARLLETMHKENGVWKWWGRTILQSAKEDGYPDCALP